MIDLTFLGTSASVPTKDRNLVSLHLKFLNNNLLFDCGEGTQRQMFKAGISPFKINNIFISHLHADHFLGIAGLIQTLGFLGRKEDLNIYGPVKLKKYIDFFAQMDYFELKYKINVFEINEEGVIFNNPDYKISAFKQEHSCPCWGFVFEEKTEMNVNKKKFKKFGLSEGPLIRELKEKGFVKVNGKIVKIEDVLKPVNPGRKIVVSMDTIPNENISKNAKNADVFICEATHSHELKEKSHEYGHMTAKDAATIAKKSDVKKLILTHFSNRYEDVKLLEKEARTIFKNTTSAEDLMNIQI